MANVYDRPVRDAAVRRSTGPAGIFTKRLPVVGSAHRYRDDQVLVIGVGMVPDRWYRVRIGRVRRWIRETARTDCEG